MFQVGEGNVYLRFTAKYMCTGSLRLNKNSKYPAVKVPEGINFESHSTGHHY